MREKKKREARNKVLISGEYCKVERGEWLKKGEGEAGRVPCLLTFFPFWRIYIYIYDLFTRFSPFIYGFATSFFERNRREGGGSNKFDFSRTVAFDHRNSRITRTPFNENLYYLCAHVGIDRIDRKRIKFKLFAPCPATNNTTRERFFDKVH